MQTVNAFGQRLAFHGHGIGEFDGRVLIGAGAPNLSIRHNATPDFSAFHQRPMVIDGDIGNADSLNNFGVLAVTRQVKYSGLRMAQSSGEHNCDEYRGKREASAHGEYLQGTSCQDEW